MTRFGTVLGGSLNFWKNCRLRFFKHFRIKEASASVLWKKFENQGIFSFGFFKNLNELMVFLKESTKNRWFFGRFFNLFFSFKLRTLVIRMPKSIIWKFWELAGKWIYRQDDNQQYPSCIQRTNEHWFGPVLVCPNISGEPQTQFQNLYVCIYIYNLKETPLCLFVCWKLTADQWMNKDEGKQRLPTSSPPNLRMQ